MSQQKHQYDVEYMNLYTRLWTVSLQSAEQHTGKSEHMNLYIRLWTVSLQSAEQHTGKPEHMNNTLDCGQFPLSQQNSIQASQNIVDSFPSVSRTTHRQVKTHEFILSTVSTEDNYVLCRQNYMHTGKPEHLLVFVLSVSAAECTWTKVSYN